MVKKTVPFSKPTTVLPGVGPKLQTLLHKCRIETVGDLLFHLPFRYQDRTRLTPIADLRENDWAVVQGTIIKQDIKKGGRLQLLCYIQDASQFMIMRFFHFTQSLKKSFEVGTKIRAFGQVRRISGHFEMAHPEYHVIREDRPLHMAETLTPIYSLTQGLTQTKLRQLTKQALSLLDNEKIELLPESFIKDFKLSPLKESLLYLHNPPPDANLPLIEGETHPAQLRLAFEELLSHHLSMTRLKKEVKAHYARPFKAPNVLKEKILKCLPFSLTKAQTRVLSEIESDLKKTSPMYRLVQGDVGAGKTMVAMLSALPALASHSQVALMAPTELLARQHHASFEKLLSPHGISTLLLTGKQTKKTKKTNLEAIQSGEAKIIIGTHALFQTDVIFHQLGLVIIDEQHRFGVAQRLTLQHKGRDNNTLPHQLVMTATPIPRTLAMTQYAHLDISIIDELPPGRTPIQTAVLDNQKREALFARLKKAFKEKKQAYWVCTLIEESETLQCQNAEETALLLQEALKPYKIGLVHGRMKQEEKNAVMQDFAENNIDLLVATTVIEVGVDVPNATLMIIENAERFGLSQLHQLRGRVGRGSKQSHCILLYQSPLSYDAQKRLSVIRESTDGFKIAKEDMLLRGSGELLGTKQTGLRQLKIANIEKHQALLSHMPKASKYLEQHEDLTAQLIRRWLGEGEKYAHS